jgi:hypothetical protein
VGIGAEWRRTWGEGKGWKIASSMVGGGGELMAVDGRAFGSEIVQCSVSELVDMW